MLKDIIKEVKEFLVSFESYQEACDFLKFLGTNTDFLWRSGGKPTVYKEYFESNDYYLCINNGMLARREKQRGSMGYECYKCSELLRETPKCLKRL